MNPAPFPSSCSFGSFRAPGRVPPGTRPARLPVAGAAAAVLYAVLVRPRLLRCGATREEAGRALPGDGLVPGARSRTTMAATLPAPPVRVWPWPARMGCDRAGWYSWDRLDNGGRPSSTTLVPRWQDLAEGDRLHSVPGGRAWFTAAVVDPPRTLVLHACLSLPSGVPFDPAGPRPRAWTEGVRGFHLEPLPGGRTRLLVRTVGRDEPRLPVRPVSVLFGEPAHLVMQRRQFRSLRARVEQGAD
ncbi:hypothetical protein [Streptomyces sp. HB2AG]|uniref:hypothetical protein n=1 Tax=Streptomyces sp. HB2AG TaxID=2983400 RepID=UPI0022AA9312|nr:hypothetical protein [Streptomyces sp. HB2AG]MCZ2526551.1 hypothetical protein [Streptomyces sp. HB2AG]